MSRVAQCGRILAICVGLALTVLGTAQCRVVDREIKVTVTNSQEEVMRDVTVAVTGNEYKLGDIATETSKSVVVEPKGESGALIRYRDIDDRVVDIDAGAYMEPGYHGKIALTVYPGGDSKLVVTVRP